MGASFQETKCVACGQLLTDPRNAVVQHDVNEGGLKGKHLKCPPEPQGEAQPGPDQHPEFARGWNECLAAVLKVLGEHFPLPASKETT